MLPFSSAHTQNMRLLPNDGDSQYTHSNTPTEKKRPGRPPKAKEWMPPLLSSVSDSIKADINAAYPILSLPVDTSTEYELYPRKVPFAPLPGLISDKNVLGSSQHAENGSVSSLVSFGQPSSALPRKTAIFELGSKKRALNQISGSSEEFPQSSKKIQFNRQRKFETWPKNPQFFKVQDMMDEFLKLKVQVKSQADHLNLLATNTRPLFNQHESVTTVSTLIQHANGIAEIKA